MVTRVERQAERIALIPLGLLALFCAVRVGLGYGADNDTYRMLGSWQHMVIEGVYVPSRFQGALVAEFFLGFLAGQGGAVLANLGVALLSLGCLVLCHRIACALEVPHPLLVPAFVAASPFYMIASATSMDYVIALFFLLAGLLAALRGHWTAGLILLGLAGGARMASVPIALGLVLGLSLTEAGRDRWRIAERGLVLIFVTGLFYLPVWISAALGFGWLDAAIPEEQGWPGLIARFLYKTPQLLGYPATLALLVWAGHRLWRGGAAGVDRRLAVLSLCGLGPVLLTFLRAPIEVSYLLPALPFAAMLLLRLGPPRGLILIAGLGLLNGVVAVDVLDITRHDTGDCGAVLASGARVSLSLGPGPLVTHLSGLDDQDRCYLRFLVQPYDHPNAPLPQALPQAPTPPPA